MTINEVVARYMELEKQGKFEEIQNELYSQDVVCIEPEHAVNMGMEVITTGLDAVIAKGKAWGQNIAEMHGGYTSEPIIAGNFFSVAMGFDATFKHDNQRRQLDEIAVFEVKDGKIIKEQFFF